MNTGTFESPEWTSHTSGNWTQSTSEGTWSATGAYVDGGSQNSGSRKFGMNDANDALVTPSYIDPCGLSFYIRTSSDPDDWVLAVQTSNSPSGPWTTQTTITENGIGGLITDTYTQINVNLNLSGTYFIRFFVVSRSSGSIYLDDISLTCGCSTNTISTSTLSSLTYSVDCSTSTTDAGNIDFTSTGTFNSGNTYIVQLSDASGDFTNATDIGSSTSTGNSGNITFTIPSEISTGSGYRIRIVSNDPVATSSDNGSDITITQTGSCEPPHLSSVIINSCNASCTEGVNELVFGNTGDYSILVSESNFNFSYSNSGSLNNYTDNLTNNATVTQELNDECSSSNPFIDAYGTTIPPNSSWVLANDAICATDALVWSGLCNAGPIYVIYSTDSDWNSGGNFSNDPSNANPLRPYQTSMTTTSGETFTIDYETDGSQYPDNDGVFATFDVNGGPATAYGDNDCSFDPLVLPAELLNFNGFQLKGGNVLSWITASEYNTSHFTIERTTDGANWESLEDIAAAGYSSQELAYQITDTRFENDINIYRLRQVDHDGTEIIFSKYVTIDNRTDSDKQLIGIYNLMGQLIDKNHQGIQIHRYSDGTSVKIFKP